MFCTFQTTFYDRLRRVRNKYNFPTPICSPDGGNKERRSSDIGILCHSDTGTPTPRAINTKPGSFFASNPSLNVHSDNSDPHHRPQGPHPPSLPAQQPKVNGDGASGPQSPPLPERHKPPDDDTPPPLPPKLPTRNCTIQFADPPVQPFPEHRASGILSPRSPPEQAVGNSSSRGPPPGSSDYAKVISSSARKASSARNAPGSNGVPGHADVSDFGQEHVKQEPVIQERMVQSARAPPQYSVPANVNMNKSLNNRSLHSSQIPPPVRSQNSVEQQLHSCLKREPPPYHKALSRNFSGDTRGPQQPHDVKFAPEPADSGFSEVKAPDPRRKPLNGMILPNGPLSLQDKRVLNNVPPLDIPSEDLSGTASDSAISDEVFLQTEIPPLTRGSRSSVDSSDFRRFSTGMLSKERASRGREEKPEVVKVDMHQEPDSGHVTVDHYPDDIYIDVVNEVTPSGSAKQLKVLPLEDNESDPLTNGR